MNASIIQINGLSLAIGGTWTIPSNDTSKKGITKKEIRDFYRTHAGNCVVSHIERGNLILGAYESIDLGREKVYSAILGLSNEFQSAIIYHQIVPDYVWIAGINHNQPLPGYDEIVPVAEAQNLLASLTTMLDSPVHIGTRADARYSLDEAIEKVSITAWKKHQLSIPQVKKRRLRIVLTGLVFSSGVVLGGMYLYMEHIRQKEQDALRQQSMTQMTQSREQVEQAYVASVKKAITEQAAAFGEGVTVDRALRYIDALIASHPVSHNGWNLNKINCDFESLSCQNEWTKASYGVSATAYTLPGISESPKDILGRSVSQDPYPVSLDKHDIGSLLTEREALRYVTLAELYKAGKITLKTTLDFVQVMPVVPKAPEGMTPYSVPALGKKSTWQIRAPLYAIGAIAEQFDGQGVRVRSIGVQIMAQGKAEVTIDGDYIMKEGR